jgi:Ni2+-binding GTPase involved in maturation of urease and hydrogenase
LLDEEKDLGRQLRTKNMAVISTSNGNNLGEKFWYPFIETANYLGMNYIDHLHTVNNDFNENELEKFINKIV